MTKQVTQVTNGDGSVSTKTRDDVPQKREELHISVVWAYVSRMESLFESMLQTKMGQALLYPIGQRTTPVIAPVQIAPMTRGRNRTKPSITISSPTQLTKSQKGYSKRILRTLALSFLLLQEGQCWSNSPTHHKTNRRQQPWTRNKHIVQEIVSTVIIAGSVLAFPVSFNFPAHAIASPAPTTGVEEQLKSTLKPPTAEQPQILLPKDVSRGSTNQLQKKNKPIVEGM